MTTWKGQAFEREWHRAMLEWIDGGRVGCKPVWQSAAPNHEWEESSSWREPIYFSEYSYRWKPKPKRTVTINGKVLVAPEVDAPEQGALVWVVNVAGGIQDFTWVGDGPKEWLAAGNVFLAREDAQAMADWLVKCRRGET